MPPVRAAVRERDSKDQEAVLVAVAEQAALVVAAEEELADTVVVLVEEELEASVAATMDSAASTTALVASLEAAVPADLLDQLRPRVQVLRLVALRQDHQYPSSRLSTKTMAMETIGSATRQETALRLRRRAL